MKHTQEPWKVVPEYPYAPASHEHDVNIIGANGDVLSEGWSHGLSGPDARRAVACVNGCAGINPSAVPELLKALELLFSWVKNWDSPFMDDPEWPEDEKTIIAAIKKAKGEE